jgi:hypothetical protein
MRSITRISACLFLILSGCNKAPSNKPISNPVYDDESFKSYWYAGQAELNSYELDQARYGENHKGEAVLIFVTEAFSKTKQVKLDNAQQAGKDAVTVMKVNLTKKFITGIYPYSMMLSVFTPVSRNQSPNTLKATMSSQEWCGHVFSQLNLNNDQYQVQFFSYFEKEGDANFTMPTALLEDEIWNLIRLDHTALPVGDIKVIPGLFFTRLRHRELKLLDARATKKEYDRSFTYTLHYPEQKRELTITYEKSFPFKIIGWEEQFIDSNGATQKTVAHLKQTLVTDYWRKNKNEHRVFRDSLDLNRDF